MRLIFLQLPYCINQINQRPYIREHLCFRFLNRNGIINVLKRRRAGGSHSRKVNFTNNMIDSILDADELKNI